MLFKRQSYLFPPGSFHYAPRWHIDVQSRSRACDPWEGTRGSGIIRYREESDWPLIWNAQFGLSRIPGFRQRIIPEPHVPSRGSRARGTRLIDVLITAVKLYSFLRFRGKRPQFCEKLAQRNGHGKSMLFI
jgi:hypothetical protein